MKKTLQSVEIKSPDKGEVSAVFATFGVVDKDGDITDPKAFTDGAQVVISSYGHKSWDGLLPVGVGTIRTTDSEAVLEGKFFLDTTHGADTFRTLKGMHEAGVPSEWSYGFDVKDSEPLKDGGAKRLLKEMQVFEVSPVLLGAGVNTRSLALKSAKDVSDSEDSEALDGAEETKEAPSFGDELDAFLASAEAIAESAVRVVALRGEVGKSISVANAERLQKAAEVVDRLKAALAPVEESQETAPDPLELELAVNEALKPRITTGE